MTKKPQMIQKEEQVTQLEAWLKENTAVVLADYRGLTVAEDTALRAELRQNDVQYSVVKNTLVRFALDDAGLKEYDKASKYQDAEDAKAQLAKALEETKSKE